jgi:hypothetical protein
MYISKWDTKFNKMRTELLNSFGDKAHTQLHALHARKFQNKKITNTTYTFLGGFCCGKNTGFLPDFIVRITSVTGESRPQ